MRWGPVVWAVARRPALWGVAARQALRLAPRAWWRASPHLPIPPADYVRFRLVTQYGDAAHAMEPADVVAYLSWCRELEAMTP